MPLYIPTAPTAYILTAPKAAEMLNVALEKLSQNPKSFLVVLEEEGNDNFCNYNNAASCIEAVKRADNSVEVAMKFIERSTNTLLVTAADINTGGLEVIGDMNLPSPATQKSRNGSPWDGKNGTKNCSIHIYT